MKNKKRLIDSFASHFFREYKDANPLDPISDSELAKQMLVRAENEIEDMIYLMAHAEDLLKNYPEDVKKEIKAKFKKQSDDMGKSLEKIRGRDIFYSLMAEYENRETNDK